MKAHLIKAVAEANQVTLYKRRKSGRLAVFKTSYDPTKTKHDDSRSSINGN